ncbi:MULTISPECIES: acyl-CoA thioesterase domain-containing protein [Gordonia]|uniref:Thioesterase family protein n=1 Tax=Gordonia cholesterolivorans TaxID=559625 RepID=A0ABP5V1T9_9ACTN|nr:MULTISPECIES: acyl-CoA thioesterase domain-containing protein [Gordonia]KJR09482.1 hypothetical protein UG54_04345 [Gordonia sihwensis]KXT58403.1 hypothetical protein Y710_02460 [Gordonia sp. QH-12]MBY4568928.1 hypothetical protein [Gordonia sihwensis]WFN93125.1 thioesterase family protein [Gordonia sihwensis]
MTDKAFFTVDGAGRYDPTGYAVGLWGPDALNGPSVCAIAARAAENAGGSADFTPARFTLELFKSARRLPTVPTTTVLRDGHRIRVIEVSVRQYDGDAEILVARGNVVFLKTGSNPPGERWERPARERTFTPPADAGDGYRPWFRTEGGTWSNDMGEYQNSERLTIWSRPFNAVPDEELTPFQRAVIAAESTSLVTNIGDGGIGFINCDLTVAVARLPEGVRVGVEADSHIENAGVSVGTANLYDEHGQFGVGMVTAVDNTRAMIDFTTVKPYTNRAPELS